ncbi:hypothetical protein D1818_24310 [Aquimarina sp. BL5]|uniref:hypothetical protein n=1 Tax=Aquimarina sp. BL5 TaxID=1714860 RepID=UPI000E49A05B|nr:hypothetical protein [Aquimarina sp. BL5]AXT53790.1 hypothetical protein D1818_24310 [Aquimarina sp. BL5]RKM96264.1 hypothetical protein D7036_20970 [Aquimarina sp. BL5]
MVKRTTPWKEGKVISVETRKGIFVLAQMLKSPYLRFYNAFREDDNWGKVDVSIFDTLFVNGVTRAFLKASNITTVKEAIADKKREDSKVWIKGSSGNRKVKAWEGSEDEKEFYILGSEPGRSLVERDIYKTGKYEHPSGLFDKIIIENIPLNANDIIDNHETMGLAVFPLTNERLYLCYKVGKNVDPTKDLKFNRELPKDYKIAVEIMSGGGGKENKEKILDEYFR